MLRDVRRAAVPDRPADAAMSGRADAVSGGDPSVGCCCCCSGCRHRRPHRGPARWLRGVFPVVLWTAYLLVGAAVFQAVEQPAAELRRELQANATRTTNATIMRLFRELLRNANDSMNATKQDRILAELAFNLEAISLETASITRWDFMNSALFCMTVVSTIGYGYVTPKTQLGRGLCIVYALIGIPLNIIVMASVGGALARATRCVNGALKRLWARCAFWQKKVGPKADDPAPPPAPPPPRARSKGEETGEPRRGRAHLRTLSPNGQEFTDWRDVDSPTPTGGDPTAARPDADAGGAGGAEAPQPWTDDATADPTDDPDSPAWLFAFLVLLYTCFFSTVMAVSQPNWTILDGFYYIIITITTIGFGDLQTSNSSEYSSQLTYYLVGSLAIVIPVLGMILLSAGISIVVNQFGKKTRAIEKVLCGTSKPRR